MTVKHYVVAVVAVVAFAVVVVIFYWESSFELISKFALTLLNVPVCGFFDFHKVSHGLCCCVVVAVVAVVVDSKAISHPSEMNHI